MNIRSPKSAAATLRRPAACLLAVLFCVHAAQAAEPSSLVLRNGRSVPLSALSVERGSFVLKSAAGSFNAGQSFPVSAASHVSERPAEIDQALALLLMDQPGEAVKLLDPVLALHKITAPVPENFWIDAARVAWVAGALAGDSAKTGEIVREIGETAGGRYKDDPYARLAEALAQREAGERIEALGSLVSDILPDDLNALASFLRGKLLREAKRNDQALEAFLTAGCVYPAGGLVIVSAAELNASAILADLDRREEAVALLTSAFRGDKTGPIGSEAIKRLESLK